MVPHALRWVVLSGVRHPVSMSSILAFARAEFMMLRGEHHPECHLWWVLAHQEGVASAMEGLVPGRVWMPPSATQNLVLC